MQTYLELKKNHEKEINNFPMLFAFSKEQFEEGKKKLNWSPDEEVVSIGMGGFIKLEDEQHFIDMIKRQEKEHFDNILASTEYVYHMVKYELANHEFGYTYETEDALETCGLTQTFLKENPTVLETVKKAIKDFKVENEM